MSEWNEQFERDEELLEKRRLRRLEMKRKRQKQQRIILAVAAVVLVLIIVLIAKGCSNKAPEPEMDQTIVPPPVEEEAPAVEPDRKATLAAVGDIMFYDTQLEDAKQEDLSYDFTDCFLAVSAYTMSADLTVGNLEMNMTGSTPYAGKPSWNAPESLATTLKDLGFDVMLTANTYSITNGLNGLANTAKFLNSAGIDHVGTHISDPDETPGAGAIMREVNGIKIAFIGFTKGVDGRTLPTNNEFCVDLLYSDYTDTYSKVDASSIMDRIDDAKALKPDIIVALCHWGSEFETEISESQEDITELMLENGVDVILGSHSHVAGPMGYLDVTTADGEEKTCFVAYSLGNFVSDMDQEHAMESLILNLEFTKSGATGEVIISDANYTPLYILDAGEGVDGRFQVLPIRTAIKSKLFEAFEPQMTEAITNLEQSTKLSETSKPFDSGK